MRKSGFTLVEMLITVTIVTVLGAELVLLTRQLFNMGLNPLWENEFGLKMRTARENLLFHAVPDGGGELHGGLLSATNLVRYSEQMAAFFTRTRGSEESISYDEASQNVSSRFKVMDVDDGNRTISDSNLTNGLLFVTIRETVKIGRQESNRVERVAIPLFGGKRDSFWDDFMLVQPGDIQWKR